MFFNQCNICNERWEAGTASTCKCQPLPDYRFNMKDAPIKYQLGKAVSTDWVMRITADRKIEVAEDVEVTEAAKKVLEAMRVMLDAQRKPLTDEMVVAAARMLSDRQAAACNVDCGDMWKLHGNDFLEDARAALEAAHGIKENKHD